MNPIQEYLQTLTRRQFFGDGAIRMGGVSLAMLAAERAATGVDLPSAASSSMVHPPLPGFPHFAPKAKAVIYLHMNGGPSQLP